MRPWAYSQREDSSESHLSSLHRLQKHQKETCGESLSCWDEQKSTAGSFIHKQKAAAPASQWVCLRLCFQVWNLVKSDLYIITRWIWGEGNVFRLYVPCFIVLKRIILRFPGGSGDKGPPANAGDACLSPDPGRSQWLPGGSDGTASACSAADPGSIPGSGRSSGEGYGNLLQYSCLENSMD